MTIRPFTILVVALLLAGTATRLYADHEHFIDPATHGHDAYWSWRDDPPDGTGTPVSVTYFIDSATGFSADQENRIRDAAATWDNDNSGALYNITEAVSAAAGDIDITYGNIDGAGGTLGQATVSYNGAHDPQNYPDGTAWHQIVGVDVEMDNSENWYNGSGSPGGTEHDFWTVILHELGHALGLGHADGGTEPGSVMLPTLSTGVTRRTLTQDDIDTITLLAGASVPEPGTWALLAVGALVLIYLRRTRPASV